MSKEKQNDKKKSSTKEYAKISRKNLLLKSLGIKQLSKKEQKRLGKTIADEQNPDTFCKCKYVGRVLTFFPFAILLLAIMQSIFISDNINSLYFVSIVAVISVVSVLLCLFKPLYFTPWSDDDNKWKSDSMFGTPMVSLSFPIGVLYGIRFHHGSLSRSNTTRIIYCRAWTFSWIFTMYSVSCTTKNTETHRNYVRCWNLCQHIYYCFI